jgi:hypothetical protein
MTVSVYELLSVFVDQWLWTEFGFSEHDAITFVRLLAILTMVTTATKAFATSADQTSMEEAGVLIAHCMAKYQVHNLYFEVKQFAKMLQMNPRERARELGRRRPVHNLGWKFVVSMVHHAAALAGSIVCMADPALLRIFVYYGGMTEWSTLFLILHEFSDRHRITSGRTATDAEAVFRAINMGLFVVTFLTFRVIGWTYFLNENWVLLLEHDFLILIFVPLTALQLHWATKIVRKAFRALH